VEERCRARLGLRSDAGVQGSVLEKCGRGARSTPSTLERYFVGRPRTMAYCPRRAPNRR
jgi:hypothetical protein